MITPDIEISREAKNYRLTPLTERGKLWMVHRRVGFLFNHLGAHSLALQMHCDGLFLKLL